MSLLADRRSLLLGLCATAGATGLAPAHAAASPGDELLHTDWAYLGRYREANASLRASGVPVDAVFLGDSITEGWLAKAPQFFIRGRICRGIGGQTTPQLLVRFRQDVVELKPRLVHIMAGTNDIAGNTGPSTLHMIQNNFLSMSDIAIANDVKLIFASVPPASDYPWRPGLETVAPIAALNAWLKGHALRIGAVYADYFSAMADGGGGMRAGLSFDHVHPTAAGYAVMEPVAAAALAAIPGSA